MRNFFAGKKTTKKEDNSSAKKSSIKINLKSWLIAAAVLIGLILFTLATFYIAGFFILLFTKHNPFAANLTTFYDSFTQYTLAPKLSEKKKLILSTLLGSAIAYGIPLILTIQALRQKKPLYGAARFANSNEIQQSGLLNQNGIVLGKWKNHYLRLDGQQFVLIAAPTRSGKGVGLVVPNLLAYSQSVIVFDPKLENFKLTAGYRAYCGQHVFLFNPFTEDFRSHRYNPLEYIRDGVYRISDLMAVGEIFYPTQLNSKSLEGFFNDQARNLFMGLGLYLCETPELPCTLGELLRQSSGEGKPIKLFIFELIRARAESDRPLSRSCVDALMRFVSNSSNTMSSILSSFNAPLGIFANPIVDAATSANDFDLRQIRKTGMSIYVGITPDHLSEASRLVNLLFSQLVNLNTKELPQDNPELKYQCLLLMDEFIAMGKMPILTKGVAYLACYNLRLMPIIQSVTQLSSLYGHDEARNFITNHALQVIFAPREQKDAQEYSDMLGYETAKGHGKNKQIGGKSGGGYSKSESEQRRALLLPQEIKEIGKDKEIILLENMKPILCQKIRYYDDPAFTSRLMPPPEVPLLEIPEERPAMIPEEVLNPKPEKPSKSTNATETDLEFSMIKDELETEEIMSLKADEHEDSM
jgi:type IV secretion system protein VirD4